jgi:hypothetical protein
MADALTEDAPRPGRPRLALPTLAACAAAGLALVVVVGLQAPAVSVGLRWEPPERRFIPDTTKLELEELFIKPVELADNGLPAWVGWVLVTLVALAILYVLAQLIRRITRRTPAVNVARTGADSGVTSEAEARILQSGLAAAIQILASERNPGNAVVQAWQGLQDAAAEAGLHRRPAETASEFTARILYRSRRSAEPIAVLLSLYQRVRFGEHTPTADQIAAARDALGVLVDLWQADFPERRPPKVAR